MTQQFTFGISGRTLEQILESCNRLVAEVGSREAWHQRRDRMVEKSLLYIDGLISLCEHHQSVHNERLSEILFRQHLLEHAAELPPPEVVSNLNDWLLYFNTTAPLLPKAKTQVECAELLLEEYLFTELVWEGFWDWKQSEDSAVPDLSEQGDLFGILTEMKYRGHRLAFLSSKFRTGKSEVEVLKFKEPTWLDMS